MKAHQLLHPFFPGWKEMIFAIFGILSFSFALKGLLIPNHFFDGGVTGISLLIHETHQINISILLLLGNIPFVILGARQLGKGFAIRTSIALILLGICLNAINFPIITHDKLLVSVFGGFFIGLGIGLGMHAGTALDGIEILASYTWKKLGFTLSEIILGLNTIIFLIAAIFFGLETAFYSMLTYFIASRTIDYVVEGIEEYTGITIVSAGKSDEIKTFLVETLEKGITIYKGERGFMKGKLQESVNCDIIYLIVTRLEVHKIKRLISAIDDKAFFFTASIKETTGGILKARSGRH